jgi:CRISPR/Cas system Type II protein with McrA/HNH and RuvC-like nuclease domain
LLNDLNRLTIKSPNISNEKLTSEQKRLILSKMFPVGSGDNRVIENVTVDRIKKWLNLSKKETFIFNYRSDKAGKPIFTEFKSLMAIFNALKKSKLNDS